MDLFFQGAILDVSPALISIPTPPIVGNHLLLDNMTNQLVIDDITGQLNLA